MDLERIDRVIDEGRIVDFFKSIVRIPSPRFHEEAVARHIATYLDGMGLKVELQKVEKAGMTTYNVVGRYGANKGGKRIVLCAHMDTGSGQYRGLVYQPEKWTKDPLGPVVEDGYFYGLGTHNDKQGVCCSVMAVDAVVRSGLPIEGEIIVAPVVAETAMGLGAGMLVKNGLKADYGVVLEGTGLDIVNVSVGKIRGRILVRGEHQHHSVHVSAVDTLRHLLEAFTPAYGDNRARTFLTTKVTESELPNVPSAAIRWVNSDPVDLDTVEAYFDVPVLHDQTPDSVKRDLEKLIAAIKAEHPEFRADVDMGGWDPPYSENFIWGAPPTPMDSPIVTSVAKQFAAVRGAQPVLGAGRRYGAASDAASFRRAGIPTIEFAPGSIGKGGELSSWPAVDERVRLKDVVDCTRIVARACAELAGQRT